MLNVDVNQLTTSTFDSVFTHNLQMIKTIQITRVVHIDDTPQKRILADLIPQKADILSRGKYFNSA